MKSPGNTKTHFQINSDVRFNSDHHPAARKRMLGDNMSHTNLFQTNSSRTGAPWATKTPQSRPGQPQDPQNRLQN